jgi:hypothetical protein
MNKITINGKSYTLYSRCDSKCYGYCYEDELHPIQPADTEIIGYVDIQHLRYAVCKKKASVVTRVFIYILIAIAAIVVVALPIIMVTGFNPEVKHFTFSHQDTREPTLDDGTVKVSSGLSYSQYATYNGDYVAVFIEAKNKKAEVKLVVGDVESEYVPAEEAYMIPMHLDMEEQSVLGGTLLYKVGETVKDYPITIEYLAVSTPEIPQGDPVPTTAVDTSLPQPTEETVVNDINEYQETDTDFENFVVIDDHPSKLKEKILNGQ